MRIAKPGGQTPRTSDIAHTRLLRDQALRPIAEQRATLSILAQRLDQAGRGALMQSLATRMRTDRRFVPIFGKLVRMGLDP
jgi:hypothetical protein